MVFNESFVEAMLHANNEYEAIAVCYLELLSYINDTDNEFVTRFIGHLSDDPEFGPYADSFIALRQSVMGSVQQMNASEENCGRDFEEIGAELLYKLERFDCPEQIASDRCIPMCLLYAIEALDEYVKHNLKELGDYGLSAWEDCGPLNKGDSKNQCLVYLQEREGESFLSEAYDEGTKTGFRKPHRPMRIGTQFHAVLLFMRNRLLNPPKDPPEIVRIPLDQAHRKSILEEKKILIASIPYIGFPTFRFHALNKDRACEPNELPDGMFFVEYVKEWEVDNCQRIVKLLDLAIQKGVHIVTFPEFVMSESMTNAIKDHLNNLKSDDTNRLLLVFAGTCYHWDQKGPTKGNNVLHIINARGKEVGCYYKYSPFLEESEEQIHGAKLYTEKHSSQELRRFYKCCEILSDRGKVCKLIDIEGIGRVLPAICRDVVDGEYTSRLMELFLPSLLVVPAWSRSVQSFKPRLSLWANTIHTASLLCNCCNAVGNWERESVTGMFYLPTKEETHMNAKPLEFSRIPECAATCRERGGCVIQIEIDFSQGQPLSRIAEIAYPEQ